MEESTICFIVNSRIGEKKIFQLNEAIKQNINLPVEIYYTQFGGHATELAKQAIDKKTSIIVAVGGDGTVNEIIQLVAKSESALAIVPTGSGNGLARHCQIPLEIEQAVKLITSGRPEKIDLGKANDIYFISNAGVGFDAIVCQAIKETKSRGLKMYMLKVVQHYFTYKSAYYQIESGGKTFTEKAFLLNVANGKEFGYGFEIAPEANLQDGMLDMILV
ncbi:MAG: NAD(+)/NADH kinase, partial [Chitinophagaceae bacterium]|nr:NAD(+)/NADH kinase [Chitinophagaceae bacterium]